MPARILPDAGTIRQRSFPCRMAAPQRDEKGALASRWPGAAKMAALRQALSREVGATMAERAMPEIDEELCTLCGECVSACPHGAASISPQGKVCLDEESCAYCGDCEDVCPVGAIALPFEIVLLGPSDDTTG